MKKTILQIMPAPDRLRAAYIDTENPDGTLIFNRVDFLALVQTEHGTQVSAMSIMDDNNENDPSECSNFVAICDVDNPPDPETIEYVRKNVREKEARLRALYAANRQALANPH